MGIFALCSLLLAPGIANAQSFEANLSTAVLGTSDMDFSNFSYGYVMPAHGVQVGVEVGKNLNVLVGLNTGTVGTDVYTDGYEDRYEDTAMSEDEYYEYEYDYDPSFQLASTVNQVTAGVRYRFDWTKRLKVTLTGQGVFAHANLRLDEDTDMEGSEVAVQYNAMAPGLLSTAGLEWAPLVTSNGRINIGMEAGYGHILGFNFKEKDASKDPISVGKINLNGQFLRMYVGTRF